MSEEQKEKPKAKKQKRDFNQAALKRYNELLEMKKKADTELKPLKQYLEKLGLLKKEEKKIKK